MSLDVTFNKFDEYKLQFIESYNNFDYDLYKDSCYKLYMLYIEGIFANSNLTIQDTDFVYASLVQKFNSVSFNEYVEFNKSTKVNDRQWEWWVAFEFTLFNLQCSEISKIVLETISSSNIITELNKIINHIDIKDSQKIIYDSNIIPKSISYYWKN